jgi:5'-3' exonuclease
MGIRYLNRFLRENVKSSINLQHLSNLKGKKIVIDISIYLYKFECEDALIENMYLMLSIFRYYNIIPLFVFDGKSPIMKKKLIDKRRELKVEAKKEYDNLKIRLNNNENILDENEKQELITSMNNLKREFVYINKSKIEQVKNLIRNYGATYIDAPGEADELCALLVIKNKVWGCLSEDNDMFIYGCPRILKYLSLINHNIVIYDMKGILNELGITQKQLIEICILSGTDYNIDSSNIKKGSREEKYPLYNILKYFKKYLKSKTNIEFYEWLNNYNKEYKDNKIQIIDIELFKKIYNIFTFNENQNNLKKYNNLKIFYGPLNKIEINKILKTDGFICLET